MKIGFFDIDGTLYEANEKRVHQDVVNTLKKLQQSGIKVVVATGRSYAYVPQCIKELDPDGFICSNGSYICIGKDIVKEQYLDPVEINQLIVFLDAEGFEYDFQTREIVYCKKEFNQLETYQMYSEVPKDRIQYEYNINEIIGRIHKINIWVDNDQQLDAILKKTDSFSKEIHRKTNHIELFMQGCTKGTGVKTVLERLCISKEEAMAFGDSTNDIPMFQEVKTSIAMGNADPILKKYATWITESAENGGIANFFKKRFKNILT